MNLIKSNAKKVFKNIWTTFPLICFIYEQRGRIVKRVLSYFFEVVRQDLEFQT